MFVKFGAMVSVIVGKEEWLDNISVLTKKDARNA
jgi:hypothetical protein